MPLCSYLISLSTTTLASTSFATQNQSASKIEWSSKNPENLILVTSCFILIRGRRTNLSISFKKIYSFQNCFCVKRIAWSCEEGLFCLSQVNGWPLTSSPNLEEDGSDFWLSNICYQPDSCPESQSNFFSMTSKSLNSERHVSLLLKSSSRASLGSISSSSRVYSSWRITGRDSCNFSIKISCKSRFSSFSNSFEAQSFLQFLPTSSLC